MKHSPFWETDIREIPCLLRNPKIYYRVKNSYHWDLTLARLICYPLTLYFF